ncbi:MAG: beta-CASP ribonuclease aCPSF1 [Nanoarchaeota archaeon]
MVKLLEEIKKHLPKDTKISDVEFEGAKIVIYSENPKVVKKNRELIMDLVKKFKKRIEIRADPSLLEENEKVKEKIKELIPKEVELTNIYFEKDRGLVILEMKYPNLLFKNKEEGIKILDEIKKETLWTPKIERALLMPSKIIQSIRNFLHLHNEDYRKFLHKVGLRIYSDWKFGKKKSWIRVSFLGASQQVGRSAFLLQTKESRILLDAGLDTGLPITNPEAFPFLDAPEFNIKDLDAIVISHAHMDHIALLPFLFKIGYEGPVYMTQPTRDLSALMLLDFVNLTNGALYGEKEIRQMLKHVIPLSYEEVTDITPDIRLTFYNAGHILGSALVHLNIGNGLFNLLYTGDFKYADTNLLNKAHTNFQRVEAVMVESTYGSRVNPPRQEVEEKLINTIKEIINNGGNVLIPVFAVGRSQELAVLIEKKWREGAFNDLKEDLRVYFDGMIWDVNAIHTAYPEYLNKELKKLLIEEKYNPFEAEIFKRVGSQKEREDILYSTGNIVLTTSGMLNGGPVIEYLRRWSDNEKNAIFFVGYQAKNTIGRQILEGVKEINLNQVGINETIKINMQIYDFKGFSGHSDKRETLNWFKRLTVKPKYAYIIHGEKEEAFALANALRKLKDLELNYIDVPRNLDAKRMI